LYKKITAILLLIALLLSLSSCKYEKRADKSSGSFTILSSSENKDLEQMLMKFAKKNNIDLNFEYTGSLNIPAMIKSSQASYDAVWSSNSIWNASVSSSVLKNSKSISINPVIFAVKESKYKSLGFNKDTVVKDLVKAVEAGKLNFLMPSVTQTNSGASAYLGFLNCLAGNPPVLTEKDLKSPSLQSSLKSLFKGVARNSGSDEYLIDIYNNGNYDALVNYESSLIELNEQLIKNKKEPLKFIYPSDGVSVSDSPFAYIDNNNENKLEIFKKLQAFLLSEDTQRELEGMGRRTTYGGLVSNDKVFKSSYGIDKNAYLSPIKYPARSVINSALNLYQDLFRKPSAVAFCLDFSGSMSGIGNEQLVEAMKKILTYDLASEDMIQFSEKDIIYIIPFSSEIKWVESNTSGIDTKSLLKKIIETSPRGGTDIYKPVEKAVEILKDYDSNIYTKSIVLMTDGDSDGEFSHNKKYDIPVFSIMFGEANPNQIDEISKITKGKTFDGRIDLINAFKEIRAYN
jgi:Ca-activated chloride channel family protein